MSRLLNAENISRRMQNSSVIFVQGHKNFISESIETSDLIKILRALWVLYETACYWKKKTFQPLTLILVASENKAKNIPTSLTLRISTL